MADFSNFQPPPTWANPILDVADPATGERRATFNPVWLKWFVDLTSVLTNSGGAGGTISLAIPYRLIPFGNIDGVLSASDDFRWDASNRILLFGAAGSGGSVRGVADSLGGSPAAFIVFGGDGAGGGGDISVLGGGSTADTGGTVTVTGGEGAISGGAVDISGGAGVGGGSLGGDVRIAGGVGAATTGNIILSGLPTAAPATSGALWRDAAAGNVVKCVP